MTNHQQQGHQLQFYPTNYGDTRLIVFKIFQKYFNPQNQLSVANIFNDILEQNARDNSQSIEDYLNQIDDDLLNQILVGMLDNQQQITDYILNQWGVNIDLNFKLILMLVIFELKFLNENPTQNIFEDYQKICQEKNIKFTKEFFAELVKEFRQFEYS